MKQGRVRLATAIPTRARSRKRRIRQGGAYREAACDFPLGVQTVANLPERCLPMVGARRAMMTSSLHAQAIRVAALGWIMGAVCVERRTSGSARAGG